jgi:hypothetical protein
LLPARRACWVISMLSRFMRVAGGAKLVEKRRFENPVAAG